MKRIILFSLTFLFVAANGFAFGSGSFGKGRVRFMAPPPPLCTATVTNTLDGPAGSLRAAINFANVNPGTDTICFNISGPGVHTIITFSQLPPFTDPVIVDGYTQPGWAANTSTSGNNAVNLIVVQRAAGPSFQTGFQLVPGSSGSTIRGLVINNFQGAQIFISSSSGNVIAGNYIGTNATGTAGFSGGGGGVRITGGTGNIIGGTSPSDANLISGNGVAGANVTGSPGIYLDGGTDLSTNTCTSPAASITGTVIKGNLIGTDRTGTAVIGNATGIFMSCGVSQNIVGGTTAAERNVISGNKTSNFGQFGQGVLIALGSHDNVVQGNYIGTNVTGTGALPNGSLGVSIGYGAPNTGAPNNIIGGLAQGAGNVISGNISSGVQMVNGATGNRVQGNLIGTNAAGTAAVPNGQNGFAAVFIRGNNNTVGGALPAARNIISGNGGIGLRMGGGSAGNTVQGNYIGTDITGSIAIGDVHRGVMLGGASNNTSRGTSSLEMMEPA